MALNSDIDKDGKINKGKDGKQYTSLNPSIKGGDNGSRTNPSEGIKEGKKPGKLFAGS